MHLAIDVREACRRKRTGKGQWTYGFVSELLARGTALSLISDEPIPSHWKASTNTCAFYFPRGLSWHWYVARALREKSLGDLYVSPTSYIVPWLLGRRFPCVPIVHDLIAFRDEPHDKKATFIERKLLPRIVKTASELCVISASTKKDLLERFPTIDPKKVATVYAGPMYANVKPNTARERIILCVGTLSPRKNQERLIQAFAMLPREAKEGFRLVLAGSRGWNDQVIVDLTNHTADVEWKEYVSDEKYEELLQQCTLFALPSLYEGFGMQVLDALQRGIPTLTSDRGSLKEVVGDAAVYVNPEDVGSIAKGLERLLKDEALREDLRRRGPVQAAKFSWQKTVDAFLSSISTKR